MSSRDVGAVLRTYLASRACSFLAFGVWLLVRVVSRGPKQISIPVIVAGAFLLYFFLYPLHTLLFLSRPDFRFFLPQNLPRSALGVTASINLQQSHSVEMLMDYSVPFMLLITGT